MGVKETGQWWWRQFVDELASNGWFHEIEGVHVHAYPKWSVYCADPLAGGWPQSGDWCLSGLLDTLATWYTDYHQGLGLGDRELWITESGCASYAADLNDYGDSAWSYCRDRVMRRFNTWFVGQDHYSAVFWFKSEDSGTWRSTALVDGGMLNPLGEEWLQAHEAEVGQR
jgi:hypothetical protein